MNPAVIGAFGQVLGGLLGRPKQKVISAGDNFYSHVGGIMNAARDFGWNPLTLLMNGQAIGPTVITKDNSAFGQAIANAGMLLGDQLSARRAEKAKMEKLNQTQVRLQKRLDTITLRSPVPGVYGGVKLPSDPEVYGGNNSGVYAGDAGSRGAGRAGPAGAPSDLPALVDQDPIDPRRSVDNKPVGNTSGFMVVDNPYMGKVYVPTLDGDEPVDILDVPAVGYVGTQLAYQKGKFLSFGGGRESRPSMTRAEALAAKEMRELGRKRPKGKPPFISLKGPTRYSGAWVQ